jgi:hypothetical protein
LRHDPCPSFVLVSPDRLVSCSKTVGHGPADDIHHGLLHVTLGDGRQHAASLVWSTSESALDAENLRRSH